MLVWFNYSAVLPLVVEEWGLSGTQAGIVFGAFQAGYLMAIVPAGWLADGYSPRWVIAIGATGTGLPSLGFAVIADGFLIGTVLRFLSGLFVAGVYVPGMRFVSDWYPRRFAGGLWDSILARTSWEVHFRSYLRLLPPKQSTGNSRLALRVSVRCSSLR